jgi:NADH-quinone oxidoreductase subunit L
MTVPLQVLAVGAAFAGFLGVPAILFGSNWFEHFLEPVFEGGHHALAEILPTIVHGHGIELGLMAASVFIAAAGIVLATRFYQTHPEIPERLAISWAGVHRVLLNKYYVDELYGKVFVRGLALGGGNALHAVDRFVVDGGDGEVRAGGGVNGLAWLTRDVVAAFSNVWDRYVVDGLVNLTAFVLDNGSYLFRSVQNGLVQQYALLMLLGVFVLFIMSRFAI